MSNSEYDDLWHYSEQFTRDKLQRSELVTMAWKEGEKLGPRCNMKLMKSAMHFRSRELNKRSAFPVGEVGKRKNDVWNHERVYLDAPTTIGERGSSLGDYLLRFNVTPLNYTITNEFLGSLSEQETNMLNDLSAGYTHQEIRTRHQLNIPQFQSLRQSLQRKAVAYL
jgi:hypothetical protein